MVAAGKISPMRTVPDTIHKPSWADDGELERWDEPRVKSADVIERMRRTARDAANTLAMLGELCQPGVTTDEIDAACHAESIRLEAYPSPLNYPGSIRNNPFPKSVCTSVNEVICHGIPDDRELIAGDIVNIDVTIYREGVHGDTNATFFVGDADDESKRLVTVTRDSLMRGIEAAKPGRPLNAIGQAIQEVAEPAGFGVVRDFVGHGIGEQFHTDLQVCHYFHPHLTDVIEPGMTFTIEPMISAGTPKVRMWKDGWTAVTADGGRTAQFEHTILIGDREAEILTIPDDKAKHPYWSL